MWVILQLCVLEGFDLKNKKNLITNWKWVRWHYSLESLTIHRMMSSKFLWEISLLICIEKHFHEWKRIKNSKRDSCERSEKTLCVDRKYAKFCCFFHLSIPLKWRLPFVGRWWRKRNLAAIKSPALSRFGCSLTICAVGRCQFAFAVVKLQEMWPKSDGKWGKIGAAMKTARTPPSNWVEHKKEIKWNSEPTLLRHLQFECSKLNKNYGDWKKNCHVKTKF